MFDIAQFIRNINFEILLPKFSNTCKKGENILTLTTCLCLHGDLYNILIN